ncbi:MAG: M48 family metalloprotease [Desulfobacteraceae bacterium]|nr:MAG: M48 family metalloprotease [Desulfobacteraceae bacterium]
MRYIVFILTLFCLSACSSTAPIPLVTEDFRDENDEKRLWQRSEDEQKVLNESGLIYEDQELNQYLNCIAKRLQPPEILERIIFKVIVIKSPYLNAFAFPNGVLYVHTGILAQMDNEAQLAALLGHEMTHCTHRHALRTLRHLKSKTGFLSGTQRVLIRFGGIGDLVNLLGSLGSRAAVSGYSRDFETEADMVGLRLMAKAGYDPNEALKLFEHIKRELEQEKVKEPFFFGTHPKLQDRVENCKDFIGTHYQSEGPGIKNGDVFLTKLHKVILHNAGLDLKAGRFDAAQREAEKYLTIKLNDARAYYLLGEIYRQRGKADDMKKAKTYYEKAISMDPAYPDPHKAIGLLYYKDGKKTLAKRSFEMCLSLSPQTADKAYIVGYLRQCNQ